MSKFEKLGLKEFGNSRDDLYDMVAHLDASDMADLMEELDEARAENIQLKSDIEELLSAVNSFTKAFDEHKKEK